MEDYVALLEETITKSTINDFRAYVKHNTGHTKWLICSDYCLDDKKKRNGIISFTLFPYYAFLDSIQRRIQQVAPEDIKKTNNINDEFLKFLKRKEFFHFCFIFENGVNHPFQSKPKDEIIKNINDIIQMLEKWKINTPINRDSFQETIKKLNHLKEEIPRASFNIKLFRNIMIVNILAAYIGYLLCREVTVELLGWFSDRDDMITAYRGIAFDFFSMNYHGLCEQSDINNSNTKLAIGIPEADGKGGMWYDQINRMPDFLCGTLADLDLNGSDVLTGKFMKMLYGYVADNNRISVIRTYLDSDRKLNCARVVVGKALE